MTDEQPHSLKDTVRQIAETLRERNMAGECLAEYPDSSAPAEELDAWKLVTTYWRGRMPERFWRASLEDCDPEATAALEEWEASDVGTNLVLLGQVGRGKTHAAVAVARDWCWKVYEATGGLLDVRFYETLQLLDALRPDSGAVIDHERNARTCAILILDDVGAERVTDWTAERITGIFTARYNAGLRTIVTSNLDPTQLEAHLGSRVYSRLAGGAVAYAMGGGDRRRPEDRSS